MAGSGRIPKEHLQRKRDEKRRRRGDWQPTAGIGWQHGDIPEPPDGLLAESIDAWQTWMRSWAAAHWTPGDVPSLRVAVLLYDACRRGKLQRAAELRLWLDTLGISPKGQQDRRWQPPAPARPAPPSDDAYAHLRVLPSKEQPE
jgi:hypothetical protein